MKKSGLKEPDFFVLAVFYFGLIILVGYNEKVRKLYFSDGNVFCLFEYE